MVMPNIIQDQMITEDAINLGKKLIRDLVNPTPEKISDIARTTADKITTNVSPTVRNMIEDAIIREGQAVQAGVNAIDAADDAAQLAGRSNPLKPILDQRSTKMDDILARSLD